MDIQKITTFLDLVETKNYSKTTERLYTTQGNISKQIIALEKELETTLFLRKHRQVELTEEARLILPYIQTIHTQYQSLLHSLKDYKQQKAATLYVLTIPTMANYWAFDQLTTFMKQHPEFDIQLKEGEGNELVPFLDTGENHFIFVRTFQKEQQLDTLVTEKDHFVAVLSKNHPLAQRESIHLSELQQEEFLMLSKETKTYQPILDLCHKAGFTPDITFETSRIELLLNMVASELGVSLVMEKTIDSRWKNELAVVPLTPNKTSYLAFIRGKEKGNLAADTFWQFLKEQFNHSKLE
ncbi:LysR family transcriptional regulator [Tetragenococcus muriaticus]|uniref:Transcriptional regulator n=1 Tax=Tetragenococcus muriaticus 3MR10-3 TaxID=1302648 RepID=A0A091BWD9_9ENTE|nr:LysR family transcriptional regulator [Tetragenococcus muriaticus]KFN89911.1 transcriptional regulator [Tetragenococcus muriaticus 3MR10-3]GMA46501.1 LysR family transcriptional regulator [Tetragenococcus muriaticus]